ncbi:MAG: hypothetical protein ACYCR4_05665 [Acidimicrobiales bacterium]
MGYQPRRPAGVPTGGQFAPTFRPRSVGLDLLDDDLVDPADDSVDEPTDESGPADPPEEPEPAPGASSIAPSPLPPSLPDLLDQARRRIETPLATGGRWDGTTAELAAAEASVTAVGRVLGAMIDEEVRRRHPDGFMAVERDEIDAYRAVTLELLGAIRPLGLPDGEELKLVDSQKPAAAVLNEVSARFPADWLAASQAKDPPLRARVSPHRAHYVPVRSYWIEEGVTMREVRYKGFSERNIPPGVEATQDGLGFWTWTAIEPRRVKAQRRSAEITVPSPNTVPAQSRQTATHELTHRLEHANAQLAGLEAAFIRRRCTDADGNNRPLIPLRGFRKEWARDGGFVDPYIGKVYERPSFWEVLSTGTESVFDGAYGGLVGRTGYEPDADHRAFVLGCLAVA